MEYTEDINFTDGKVNIYEFLYAFNEIIKNKFPKYIAENTEGFAFTVLCSVLQLHTKDLEKKLIENIGNNYQLLVDICNAIILTTEDVINSLEPYSKIFFDYKEFQLTSFIVSAFRNRYEIIDTLEEKKNYSTNYNIGLKNIPIYYLLDSFDNF